MMILQSFFWIFLGGAALGYVMAGKPQRSLVVAASPMPLGIVFLFAGLIAYVLATDSEPEDGYADLAAASLIGVGALAALVAFLGGLLGVRWRRKGAKLR